MLFFADVGNLQERQEQFSGAYQQLYQEVLVEKPEYKNKYYYQLHYYRMQLVGYNWSCTLSYVYMEQPTSGKKKYHHLLRVHYLHIYMYMPIQTHTLTHEIYPLIYHTHPHSPHIPSLTTHTLTHHIHPHLPSNKLVL